MMVGTLASIVFPWASVMPTPRGCIEYSLRTSLINLQSRTHLALEKGAAISRPVMPAAVGRIVVSPHVGGLHHRYHRAAP